MRRRLIKRWLWPGIMLVIGFAALCIFHPPICRGAAELLAVDDPLETRAAVALVEEVDGNAGFEEVAAIHQQGLASKVLIIERPPARAEQLGILESSSKIALRELTNRGVESEDVVAVKAVTDSDWDAARALGDWLGRHPSDTLTVICGDFSGRRWQHICRSTMDESCADRIFWRTLPDRRYDESNWWTNKFGILAFCDGCVRLLNAHGHGAPKASQRRGPAEYEQLVERRFVE